MNFVRWSWQVIRKGFWILGFLPVLLDYTIVYVPAAYVPSFISEFLQKGISLQVSLALVLVCLLLSAFLVHSETAVRLSDYEDHAPKYRPEVRRVTSKLCPTEIQVESDFYMKSLNPWSGYLAKVTTKGEKRVGGLVGWEIEAVYRPIGSGNLYSAILDWPFPIPPSSAFHFKVIIHSEIAGPLKAAQRRAWRSVKIPLWLLIGHSAPRVGQAEKLLPLGIRVDLGDEFDSIMASQADTA